MTKLHVVYQGEPGDVEPLIKWCNLYQTEYFLTHVISTGAQTGHANEVIQAAQHWDDAGNPLIHQWQTNSAADEFRIFKQLTYSMNFASLARLKLDLKTPNTYDAVLYFNAYKGGFATTISCIKNLQQDEMLVRYNDLTGDVDFHCFITRPHNFDRISLLWKRNDLRTELSGGELAGDRSDKNIWRKWIRALGLKVKQI